MKHISAITLMRTAPVLSNLLFRNSAPLDAGPGAAPMKISTPKPEPHVVRPVYTHHALDKNLVAHHSPQSFEAEQFRMLRTNIMFPAEGKSSPRTILVTSALPGEGKSFVSSNLALTIAQNIDKHVLLIDCDMRRPTVHKLFGYENVPGLSNYLVGERALSDLLIKTGNNHLSILPGGPVPPNPAELLSLQPHAGAAARGFAHATTTATSSSIHRRPT